MDSTRHYTALYANAPGEYAFTAGSADELLQSESLDGYTRESWQLWTEPTLALPFYLLRPDHQTGPLPLVVIPHGHNPRICTWDCTIPRLRESISKRAIATLLCRQ